MLRTLWVVFMTLTTVSVLLFTWSQVPTGLFLRPLNWTRDPSDGLIHFQRHLKWPGPVFVSWNHTFYADGVTCVSSGFRASDPNVLEELFQVPPNLKPCIDAPGGASAVLTWSIMFLGTIPMRPVTLAVDIPPHVLPELPAAPPVPLPSNR